MNVYNFVASKLPIVYSVVNKPVSSQSSGLGANVNVGSINGAISIGKALLIHPLASLTKASATSAPAALVKLKIVVSEIQMFLMLFH